MNITYRKIQLELKKSRFYDSSQSEKRHFTCGTHTTTR